MKRNYYIFILLYFLLNIINTYFLTSLQLNRYIAPFNRTVIGEINAVIGNFSILLLIFVLAIVIFKKNKNKMIFLLIVTFFLNILIFASGVFNLYYSTAFSMKNIVMFNNPAQGFALGIIKEVLLELIKYYRILVFTPFIILLILLIVTKGNDRLNIGIKNKLFLLLSSILLFFIALSVNSINFHTNYNIRGLESSYSQQNLGVYPQILSDSLGIKFELVNNLHENDDELLDLINLYNKNKSSYNNFFTREKYSNRLLKENAIYNLHIDEVLSSNNDLHGILKDRNLVLIHLESFNYFLLENDYTSSQLPFLQAILKESVVFHKFYNNVGMGVSSDAEMAVLTGLNPTGDETLYWEFNNKPYNIDSLPKLFNNKSYYTKAIHGDLKTFYNRDIVYPNLYKFKESYFLDDFINDGYIVNEGYLYDSKNNLVHHSPWISDYHLADEVVKLGNNYDSNFFLFPISMMGHTPYDYNPVKITEDSKPDYYKKLNTVTKKYIDYTKYYDETIKRYFISDNGTDATLDNTVYIFYSDHGSGIKNGDLNVLFNKNISILDQREMLQRTLSFIYVPGEKYTNSNGFVIREGLLKGDQNLVRSEIDLYRTIIELFDLPVGDHPYFGVHGLSNEPTFALENRIMDVALDSYFFSMRNKKTTHNSNVNEAVYEYILNYKKLNNFILDDMNNQQKVIEINRNQD